jgi:signal transduction histidine kinase
LSAGLRPEELDVFGLIDALENHTQEFEKNTQIPCGFDSSLKNIDLDKERAISVYRIVQEALTNVARHAGASKAAVKIRRQKSDLIVEINDDGVGIPQNKLTSDTSYGILGMRERVVLFNGSIRIETKKGKGTQIKLRMPLERKND